MGNKPKISIVVPVYNVEKYLERCVQSILYQTFSNFELLLVNDGSLDKSGKICDEWAKRDIRIHVFHQRNMGLSDARNTGISHSIGDLITFIDSDDYVSSNYLADLYNMLPAKNDCFRGLIIEGFRRFWPDEKYQDCHLPELYLFPNDFYKILTDLIHSDILYAWAKLYSNILIKNNNLKFVSGVSGLEDMLFVLDYVLCADHIAICDRINYMYGVGFSNNSLSVCILDFDKEYLAFVNFRERIYQFREHYALSDSSLTKSWASLTVFFHKVLLSIYQKKNNYSYWQRLHFLRKIKKDKASIKKYFTPEYKVDKLGKFILCYGGVFLFDIWMSFFIKIKFKKMFGSLI